MEDKIKTRIQESIEVKQQILSDRKLISAISQAAQTIIDAIRDGNKVLVCGNGGSAADSQHFVAELVGKFYHVRKALPAIALTVNTSILTSVANDYSYNAVFSRQVEAIGKKGDVLIGISTSGNSANVIKAITVAKDKGIYTIGLTGATGGQMRDIVDLIINVPSSDTPRIQEAHILILHIIAEIIEFHLCKF